MKKLFLALLLCFTPFVVQAVPLKVINVSAPAINCVFNPTCTVTVNDTSDNISMSTGGTGVLQSRTYPGAPGSPAAGLYAYEYRIDLRNAVGAVAISCIDSMTISFGPVVGTLNYGGTLKPDQVFVITGGGIGSIGLASAIQTGSNIKFNFTSPICEGGAPGKGDSSFFWGLVSKTPPKFVTATLHEAGGATHSLKARAPK
ncbi:MAG: hypothetical protein QOH41_3876 [Blastocatellia bacterium]|jgi:hypothetical protein|nr:hypothetical protein [Blastocatellia bacterium]